MQFRGNSSTFRYDDGRRSSDCWLAGSRVCWDSAPWRNACEGCLGGLEKSGAADRCSLATINAGEKVGEGEEGLFVVYEAFDRGYLLGRFHGRVDEISRPGASTR